MKRFTFLTALLLTAAAGRAETFNVGARGTFTIVAPKDWTISSQDEADSGLAITMTAPAGVNASGLFNLSFVPKDEPVTREQVRDSVQSLGLKFVDQSVEKKETLRDFPPSQGYSYGYYCVFTDASMVGQPAKKDSFKVVAVGIVHVTDDLLMVVGISCDDEKGADFTALMNAVTAASFSARK